MDEVGVEVHDMDVNFTLIPTRHCVSLCGETLATVRLQVKGDPSHRTPIHDSVNAPLKISLTVQHRPTCGGLRMLLCHSGLCYPTDIV
jgi:hypothetical protein